MSSVKAASLQALLAAATRVSEDVVLSSGDAIPVRGLTVLEVITVLKKFPKARDLLLSLIGGADGGNDQDFAMGVISTFLDEGPEALSHVVATAASAPGDEAFASAVRGLSDEDFTALLEKVVTLTMPEGAADFFNRLADMAGRLGMAAKGSRSAEAA